MFYICIDTLDFSQETQEVSRKVILSLKMMLKNPSVPSKQIKVMVLITSVAA